MVATDMYGKSPYRSGYTESRKSVTSLRFLLSFLIVKFYNFSYIFTLHHCSAICWGFILRLIRLDMCIIFLFVSVIIVFVYDSDGYRTDATSGKWALYDYYILIPAVAFCYRGFCLVCFSSPESTSFFYCK